MRDPADLVSSPYEVLGLPVTATQKEINDALAPFLRDPEKKPRMREAMEARKRLTDPIERLTADFFQYDLLPGESPEVEGLLRAGKRTELADRWEKARANKVGADPRVDHNLGVLYWWSAVAGEAYLARTAKASAEDSRKIDSLWLRAIPNLVFVAYLPGHWEAAQARLKSFGCTLASGDEVAPHARRRILDEAAVRMGAYAASAQEKGDAALQQRWSGLRTHFDVERTSTEELAQLIREGHFKDLRPCGPLLAAMFNGREFIYSRLSSGQVPRERVAKLLTYFSPVGRVQLLVDEQRFDEALATLDALPADARERGEARALYATALAARAKILLAKEETIDAGAKELGKAAVHARKAGDASVKKIVETGKDIAAGWINVADYEKAISLLEPLYDALSDVSVRDLLVVAYCDRGSIRVMQGRDTRDLPILLDGVKDLETSVQYDTSYKRGWEYLDVARRLVVEELAKVGYVDLSVEMALGALKNQKTETKTLLERVKTQKPQRKAILVTLSDQSATSGLSYSTPPMCSCCADANPAMKRTINGERRSGNMKHTLSVSVPYCKECNDHAKGEGARFGAGCFAFIGMAVFFFAWLQQRIDPAIFQFNIHPRILAWSFWALHVLAAICVAARVSRLIIPDAKLGPKHAVAGEAAWISSFYTGTMTLGFRNPAVGIAFALANKGTTSEVKTG